MHPHTQGQTSWQESRPRGIRDQWNYRSFTPHERAIATKLVTQLKAGYDGKKTRRRLWKEEKERARTQNVIGIVIPDPYFLEAMFPTRRRRPQHSDLFPRVTEANMLRLSKLGLTPMSESNSKSNSKSNKKSNKKSNSKSK
jgi:hypothetical protein